MNIIAILGSPKGKGNGYKAIQELETYLKIKDEINFKYIFLKDMDIKNCKGCFLCVSKGIDMCPLKDDRELIEKEIEKADGIILNSPGYVSNVSGLMKNLIDRLAYLNHRPKYFNKKLLLIANGGSGLDKTIEAMEHTLGGGPEIVAKIEYLSPPWQLKENVIQKRNEELRKVAELFCQSINKNELPAPPLSKYIRFRFFKEVSQKVKKYLPADYEYYKNKKDYFYKTKISLYKKIIAWCALKIGFFMMKEMEAKE